MEGINSTKRANYIESADRTKLGEKVCETSIIELKASNAEAMVVFSGKVDL